ncbi:hypothetical protein Pst134EA_032675 [Puccinia striiformis f. sp. tritici]|uniref:uncharacterized protein n=2 Tax=Puccinia striiformis f. sp. tritici TaxID=168172 RepID=UPI002007213D|nr:uncharacterized protein Pst134EA_032675 [Puccinia striiformis f. sp. tritici]KAH9441686.1 hypothetical protein Pst134EA_032675 [Puccinia striiformis f. sp. tritici]KAI9623407.1 hypothetical protein H4Q26_014575 [Puccinia striiformis f. sp. tritici PST-130]
MLFIGARHLLRCFGLFISCGAMEHTTHDFRTLWNGQYPSPTVNNIIYSTPHPQFQHPNGPLATTATLIPAIPPTEQPPEVLFDAGKGAPHYSRKAMTGDELPFPISSDAARTPLNVPTNANLLPSLGPPPHFHQGDVRYGPQAHVEMTSSSPLSLEQKEYTDDEILHMLLMSVQEHSQEFGPILGSHSKIPASFAKPKPAPGTLPTEIFQPTLTDYAKAMYHPEGPLRKRPKHNPPLEETDEQEASPQWTDQVAGEDSLRRTSNSVAPINQIPKNVFLEARETVERKAIPNNQIGSKNSITTSSTEISSHLPKRDKILSFDGEVFETPKPTKSDEVKINAIKTTFGLDVAGRELRIRKKYPEEVHRAFIKIARPMATQSNLSDSMLTEEERLMKNSANTTRRKLLMQISIDEFNMNIKLWHRLWLERTGVDFQSISLIKTRPRANRNPTEICSLFMFYVDMIGTILSAFHSDGAQEIHDENAILLSRAAEIFSSKNQALYDNQIGIVNLRSPDINNNLTKLQMKIRKTHWEDQAQSTPHRKPRAPCVYEIVWNAITYLIKTYKTDYPKLYRIFFPRNGSTITQIPQTFFNDIFCYSIFNLNKRLHDRYPRTTN